MKFEPSYIAAGLLLVAVTGAVLATTLGKDDEAPPKRIIHRQAFRQATVSPPVVQADPHVAADPPVARPEAVQEVMTIPGEEPNQAFPNMHATENDVEAELAQVYTYDNLQESMLNEAMDVKRNIRSRPAFSRLGDRSNPEGWDAQLREVRQQIRDSGQSLRDFIDSSWTPIPEQLSSLWEAEEASAVPEVRAGITRTMTREAMAEAAFLTREAMQDISVRSPSEAKARMQEIYLARVRAKTLDLNIPPLSVDQKRALEVWKGVEPDLVKSLLEM